MKISAVNYKLADSIQGCKNVPKCRLTSSSLPKVVSLSEYRAKGLTFTGNTDRNKEQVVFIGAESAPYSKAGGVGTVMKDYRSYTKPENQVEIIPYYGANNFVDSDPSPKTNKDGNYIMPTPKGDIILTKVSEKTIQWGKENDSKIILFKPKDDDKNLTYIVFVDSVASMEKPYQNTFVYRSGGKQDTDGWNGDPYAKFSKAAIEFLPDIMQDKPNFNPATVVCSDSQTAYAIEYMAQKTTGKTTKDDFDGIKPTYIGHNLGPGYCGETSMQNMFVNLGATPDQIEKIENDPIYKQGLKGDDFFKPFVKKTLDETGVASAVEVPLYWANKGYVKSISVVAEDYAKSIAENPQSAHNIHASAHKLYKDGVFNGILNPLNDPSVDSAKILPNVLYNKMCTDIDGTNYEPFEIYPENPTYDEVKSIKNRNKARFLKRLSAKDSTIITGTPSRTAKINPEIDDNNSPIREDLIKLIENGNGDKVPLFVSWGRCDTQKGHDITVDAFKKFAKTEEGKNAILVLGAGLENTSESKHIENKIKELLKDPDLKGRVVHIDGWAPAYAMASAADAAIFSSRFEPCGLTDLEAMKYFCTPLVTNTQGFKQKNFDPRIEEEKDKATSFKTKHEYNLLKSQIQLILDANDKNNTKAREELKKEFPTFKTKDKDGNDSFNYNFFSGFCKSHNEFLDKLKEKFKNNPDYGGELPSNWDDWDELSKSYSFKFDGYSRALKDGILASEMADSMSAFIKTDTNTKKVIFNNLKNLQTGWKTNSSLHPDGKSSYELYKERHLDSNYSEPNPDDVLDASKIDVDAEIEKHQSKDLEDRASTYGVGTLLTGLGVILGRLGVKAKNADEIKKLESELQASKSRITELEGQLASASDEIKNLKDTIVKNNKKAGIIAAACTVGGIVLTGITAYIIHRHSKKKGNNPVQSDNLQLNQTGMAISPLTYSLKEFKNTVKFS